MNKSPLFYALAAILIAFTAVEGLSLGQQAEPQQTVTGQSGFPIPRFLSLGSDEINLRTGPGDQYPILWVYVREGLPVEITAEYDVWRRIRDVDGTIGWVHSALLSGNRTALIAEQTRTLYAKADSASEPVLKAEAGVIGKIERCRRDWCEIDIEDMNAWIPKNHLWGVFAYEDVN